MKRAGPEQLRRNLLHKQAQAGSDRVASARLCDSYFIIHAAPGESFFGRVVSPTNLIFSGYILHFGLPFAVDQPFGGDFDFGFVGDSGVFHFFKNFARGIVDDSKFFRDVPAATAFIESPQDLFFGIYCKHTEMLAQHAESLVIDEFLSGFR